MPDLWMDVDANVTVPVNILPLLDDTDFKSIEPDIAYDAAGIALTWHFYTTAGVGTATAVTPTTGGNYDWTEDLADKGTYKIEIPASGGVSINNDTEGVGWFTGVATGVLPWRGPTIGFRAAGLNNALIDSAYSATRGLAGTALPDAAADAAGGLPISDAGGLDLDTLLTAAGGDVTIATNGLDADSLTAAAANVLADAVLSRGAENVEAGAGAHTLASAVLHSTGRTRRNQQTIETYRSDGTTLHMVQTLVPDPTGQPVSEIGDATTV